MAIMYIHLSYEDYKNLERQMKEFKETAHTSTAGFYHRAVRLRIDASTIMEFHGPLVGGAEHLESANEPAREHVPVPEANRQASQTDGLREGSLQRPGEDTPEQFA